MYALPCVMQGVFAAVPDPWGVGLAHGCFFGLKVGNPLALPVGGVKEAGFPRSVIARGRWVAFAIPDGDAPEIAGFRLEGGSGIGDVERLVGGDATAVPDVDLAGGGAGDFDSVGGLFCASGI